MKFESCKLYGKSNDTTLVNSTVWAMIIQW